MFKRYILLLPAFVFVLAFLNTAIAANGAPSHVSNGPQKGVAATTLHLNEQVRMGAFSMQITALERSEGHAAKGMGRIFVPLLQRAVAVQFDSISVDETGELMSGEVHAQRADLKLPTYRSKEAEVMAYLQYANSSTTLPLLLNTNLQAMGMDLGGHDLVMTNLAFTHENASFDAAFLVQNTDGSVTTFTHQNIPLAEDGVQWCDMQFEIVGGNQPSTNDPAMPIIIKGYNVDTQTGTYVAFSCAGFEEFHLEGEYRFDTQHIRLLANQSTTRDTVIASFSLVTEVWGQFMASVTFNGPFEIKGVDDVIITLKNATIDYSDTANPPGDSLTAYIDKLPVLSANKNIWRGFFIETLSVQMPSSLAVSNGNRILIDASNLIYDRSRGLTTTFSVLGKPNIAKGSLEGWGIEVNKILLQVLYSSPKKFEIAGNVNIPLMTGQIGYNARFNFPGAAPAASTTPGATAGTTPAAGGVTPGITPTTKASLSFELTVTNSVFTVPLLQGAELRMTNSVAGFEYVNSKFTPYANLNGVFKLNFTDSGGSAAEFKFPELGFQNLALNYDFVLNKVIAEPPPQAGAAATPSGGLRNMAIRAFTFAGQTFLASTPSTAPPSGAAAPAAATSTASTSTAPGAAGTPQTVKGFPISIKNIKFGSQGDFKKLDFTIALNFTNPSMGLAASADLAILGKLNVGKIMTSAPWEALAFESLLLNSITIGTKDQPCNIGGVSLYGGLIVIRKDPTYGDGFKGFLVMSVEPGITVDVVGQFGTIPQIGTAESYRYWFADAKMTIKAGIRLGPAPLGVFGFGGGAYYNMTQATLPASSSLNVNVSTPPQPVPTGTTFTMSNDLLVPGQGLSCRYTPRNNTFGVKATVVLGTHPKPETANMDLTLTLEFNTSPFGLRTVALEGAVFFMAPIESRKDAKVNGTMAIIYNHTQKTLSLNGGVVVAVKAGTIDVLTGGGNFAMFFNLNPGQSSDWYMAIGSPPISKRMRLQFNLGTSQTIEGYFVAGNINRLPPDQRTLPRLREYDPLLQQFEGQTNLNFDQLMGGNGILMGMRYAYAVEKKVWIIYANLRFTVGFDAILTQQMCAESNPTGIDNWYIRGQLYGALEGSLKIRVNLLFRKGTFNIATLSAAALLTAELPNPTWMKAQLAGSYRILGGLVKGKFKIDVEFGTKCTPLANNLDAGDVVANIKVIGDIFPPTGTTDVPVFREKIVVASYLESVNKIMDFSEESDDGLMVKPVIHSTPTITDGITSAKGYWRYLNANNIDVGANGNYDKMEFVSTKLLTEQSNYTFNLRISWKKKTRDNPNWTDVWLKNVNDKDSIQHIESKSIRFKTGRRPTELPVEAVLASFPEIRAINYGILENPAGAGIALKQEGWGYLFNPKKRIKENATPCEPIIAEYNYFLRIMDVATNKEVFEEPLTAVPIPEWNKEVGDPQYRPIRPCRTGNPFWDWIYRIFNVPCITLIQGPCKVMQPTKQAAKSNVKNMANAWGFGGTTRNFDLAVSQNANITDMAIGFPNFSGSLEKGKVYRFELVGHPILEADTYTINASAGTSTTVTTASGNEYTVTESGTQSIQGQFSSSAPEKILYQSVFGTSQFNNFTEKLGNSRPAFAVANPMQLRVGQDTLFNNALDFRQSPSDFILNPIYRLITTNEKRAYENTIRSYASYPIKDASFEYLYNYCYAPIYFSDITAPQYRLDGITEGFDVYEMSRLAYFANYDFNTGYSRYMKNSMPFFQSYEKTTTNPFENDIIPKGPYIFCSNGTSNISVLPVGSTVKQNAMGIELKFYPRTTGIYKIYQLTYTIALIGTSIYSYPYLESANALPTYGSIPASNGDLFKLKYTKGTTSANLAFNKEGVASGSYLDYSGDYWLQNVGSGRTLRQEKYSKVVSTNTSWPNNVSDNSWKFRLTRNADGTYLFRNLSTYQLLSQTSTTNDITGNSTGLNITLIPAANGSFQFRAPDGSFLVENFTTKTLQKSTAANHFDYDRFILSTSDITPPTDLNQVYRLQNLASGRYVYDGNDSPGNVVTTKKENRAANAQFQLRRREGGFYDLIATNGRRILAKMVDNDWIYTTSNETGLDESHYQFSLENQSGANYRLKNKKSEEYLYENFDVTLGETHRQLLGSLTPTGDGYDVFVLSGATTYTAPTDLSGQYLIQTEGSGRYLHDDGAVLSTNIQENTASSRFVLKKVINGTSTFYEIWNKETGRRMHWETSGGSMIYKTSNLNLAKTEYSFTLETTNNGVTYAIKKGLQNLFEAFDLDLGTTHRTLRSSATITDTDYARFKLLQEKDADGTDTGNKYVAPTDISGRYFIQTKGSERFLQYDATNPLFAEVQTNFRRFVLKRRNGTDYEIWCRNIANGGRLYPKTGGGFTFDGTTPDQSNYLFTFTPDADGWRIIHKKTAAVLYEHFELGNTNDKKLLSGVSSGGHYATFLLKEKDNAPTNYAGLYRIRSRATNQYWRDNNLSDNAPSFLTSNVAQSTIFKLVTNGSNYILQSPEFRTVEYSSNSSFWGFPIRSTTVGVVPNADGSVKLNFLSSVPFREAFNTINLSSSGFANTDFFLEPSTGFTTDNLSGEYRVQGYGSGQYLQTNATGTALAGSTNQLFVFQKQGTGIYEIKNKANNLRLHAAQDAAGNWSFTTAVATDLTDQHYQFKLTPRGSGLYAIQCMANGIYLYENFELNPTSPLHKQILGSFDEKGEYGLFYLRTAFTAPPANISGVYLLKGKGSGRYVHCGAAKDGGLLTTTRSQINDDNLWYILKRRAAGDYEIWSKVNGTRVHTVSNGSLSIVETPDLPDASYRFTFTAVAGGNYEIFNSNKVYEYFDVNRGPKHGQIWNTGAPRTGFQLFALETAYLRPNDLSGEYLLRTFGSGRHLCITDAGLRTLNNISSNYVRFLFERQTDGSYKIKSKGDGQYLHLSTGGTYTTTVETGLAANAYLFNLSVSDNLFRLQCKANNEYLYEKFDLNMGTQHRQILSAAAPDADYHFFYMESEYNTPPEDISGDYLIQVSANGKHLVAAGTNRVVSNWPATDNNSIHFVVKRRGSGFYEIWGKESALRIRSNISTALFNSTTEFIPSSSTPTLGEPEYLYAFERQANGMFRIKNNAVGYWRENNQNFIGNGGGTTNTFRLASAFTPIVDVSGQYLLKVQGSNRHIFTDGNTLSTTWNRNDARVQFLIEKQANNAFRIKSLANNQYLHLNPSGGYSTDVVPNLAPSNYEFSFVEDTAGVYKILCRANGQYLYEFFDLRFGPRHRQILGSMEQNSDYNFFLLEKTHTPLPMPEINGAYFVRTKGSELYWNEAGMLTTGAGQTRWIFKPRVGGTFEIWNGTTLKRLHSMPQRGFSSADMAGLAEDNYRFVLIPNGNSYRIECKGTGTSLFENYDPSIWTQNQLVNGTNNQTGDNGLFQLSTTYTVPPIPLFGVPVVIINRGSEGVLTSQNGGSFNPTFGLPDMNALRFRLRWQSGGFYELWSVTTKQRLCLTPNGLAATGMTNDHYLFRLIADNGAYQIQCKANNQFLTESVNSNQNTVIHIIGNSILQGDDSRFNISQNYMPITNNISGKYWIKVSGANRWLFENGGAVSTSSSKSQYYLRRRAGEQYEIWSMFRNARLTNVSGTLSAVGNTPASNFLFTINRVGNEFNILQSSGILNELRTTTGASMFRPGTSTYSLRLGASSSSNSIIRFVLEPIQSN